MSLRPHVAQISSQIRDVAPLAAGGYAVLTSDGIEVLDDKLARQATIRGESDRTLVVVADDHFLVHGGRLSWLYEGKSGGALSRVDLRDGMVQGVAVTPSGFHAFTTDHVLVEHAGTRTFVALEGKCAHGGDAWRGGSVVSGHDGLAILAADGSIVAEASASLRGRPVAFADGIAVPDEDGIALFDGAARAVTRIPYTVESDGLVPFRAGLLAHVTDDDGKATDVVYWTLEDGVYDERWDFELQHDASPPVILGERVVIAAYRGGVQIVDAAGTEVASVPTTKPVDHIAAFGDGVAMTVRDSPDVLWWRAGAALATLAHDASPGTLRSVPAGALTFEGDVLFLWRPDEQGPAWTPVTSGLPIGEPIVVGGEVVTIQSAGRFALRGMTPSGQARAVAPDAAWRPLTSRDVAKQVLERLIARTFDRPLPALSDGVVYHGAAKLAQLPLVETVDLFGRSLFAQSTLDERTLTHASFARRGFFDELGHALGTSGRVLLAAVKARKLKLDPPRPIADYDYLGTFTTSGDLTVSDPCYIGKKGNAAIPLALKVQGLAGVWHVFVRGGAGTDRDRNAEFVTIHDDGFEVHANEAIGSIGVDSGTAGVFDKKCPKRDENAVLEEGTFAALGAVASTGYGDGFYPVLVGRAKGRVAKIRIHFIGDDTETDRSMPKSTTLAQPYSASQRFAMGDTIQHVKFGTGAVVRVGGDGKIDVRFADGTRTLVHAKK